MAQIIGVRFKEVGKVYYFDPCGIETTVGQHVIVETARGVEYGEVAIANKDIAEGEVVKPLKKLLRVATHSDEKVVETNQKRAKEAFAICEKKIVEHKLDMKLVSVEYTFDLNKVLFYFTADGRVDFRELVKDLASVFRTRIELRQIGVRDEAKVLGGLGICGRPLCCASFLDDFQPVSINMAKQQNLSLNPTKISGTCGRLMCCLKYEQEAYEELARVTPRVDSTVQTPDGVGVVLSNAMLRGQCTVQLEDDPDTPRIYACTDCQVLQAGRRTRRPARPTTAKPAAAAPKVAEKLVDTVETAEQGAETQTEPQQERRRAERPKRRRKNPDAAPKSNNEKESGEKQEKSGKSGDKQHKNRPRRPRRERSRNEQGDSRPAHNERRASEDKEFVDAHRPPRRRRPKRRPKEENKTGAPEA